MKKLEYSIFEITAKKNVKTLLIVKIFLCLNLIIFSCKEDYKFIIPDLPEKLCTVSIVDADGIVRKSLIFGKSYQDDYSKDYNDSIRELYISLSDGNKELFKYYGESAISVKSEYTIGFADNITFNTGEKYYIQAHEKNTQAISAEITLPEKPPLPSLISVEKSIEKIPDTFTYLPQSYYYIKSAVLNIFFSNDRTMNLYYAILIEGMGIREDLVHYYPWLAVPDFIDYRILECNSPGFLEIIKNFTTHRNRFDSMDAWLIEEPVKVYFIDGSSIPGNKCNIKLSVQVNASQYSPVFNPKDPIRIRLLSIPKELYFYEKNLYAYNSRHDDPFSEPVYLSGNVKGGLGIFAICRSSEISVTLPWEEILALK